MSTLKRIYLDHNSNTPMSESVKEEFLALLAEDVPGNPSSVHYHGRAARSMVEKARLKVKRAIGIEENSRDYNVVFTASCTEANNIAIRGCSGYRPHTVPIEHHSVLNVIGGSDIKVRQDGTVDMTSLEAILQKDKEEGVKSLVCLGMANSSLGVLQDIRSVSDLTHSYGGLLLSDAAQAFGKAPIDIVELGADIMTLSSHKMGGPSGVGAIVFKSNIHLSPLLFGGKQEMRLRPGSHNTTAIHAFGLAAELADKRIQEMNDMKPENSCINLRNYIEKNIVEHANRNVIFSSGAKRIPNTTSIMMPNVKAEVQIAHFDQNNISVSAGYSCASGVTQSPYVIMALGASEEEAFCTIRVSLGLKNTKDDAEAFIKAWKELYNRKNSA